MQFHESLETASFFLITLCIGSCILMWRKGLIRQFPLPTILLLTQAIDTSIRVSILFFRKDMGLDLKTAYHILFWGSWGLSITNSILRIVIIYIVFHLAMRPMEGLNRIGKIVFRWVAAVSILTAFGFAAGARPSWIANTGTEGFTHFMRGGID